MFKIPGNNFDELPEIHSSKDFSAFQLIHVVLGVSPDSGALKFEAVPSFSIFEFPISYELADTYLLSVGRKNPSVVAPRILDRPAQLVDGPYDIKVTQQCFIVIELASSLSNWQFQNGFFACTTKEDVEKGDNFRLRHVHYADPTQPNGKVDDGMVLSDGVRVMMFCVAKREKKTQGPKNGHRGINLHVQFKQDSGRVMTVIFDPDVPNDGPDTIP